MFTVRMSPKTSENPLATMKYRAARVRPFSATVANRLASTLSSSPDRTCAGPLAAILTPRSGRKLDAGNASMGKMG